MKRLSVVSVVLALAAVLVLLGGCGSGSDDGTSSRSQRERGQEILSQWSDAIAPTFEALSRKDDAAVNARLPAIEKWGRDARKAFLDDDPTTITRAITQSGDSWTLWARTLRTDPPLGDFDKARHQADLGAEAIRDYRGALQSVGVDPDSVVE